MSLLFSFANPQNERSVAAVLGETGRRGHRGDLDVVELHRLLAHLPHPAIAEDDPCRDYRGDEARRGRGAPRVDPEPPADRDTCDGE